MNKFEFEFLLHLSNSPRSAHKVPTQKKMEMKMNKQKKKQNKKQE